ncbi:High-affinity glucose transporter [Purpureocillium lavendulum]|uniref:High-affinity glucose transporter n=1 Tax=Purpureocillium lavendulum TaxID=1247861 RepID=A0AB34FNA8_9HYPO|nr:High-affinity glucose transporter [Purpureocillium lavendulum]
MSSDNIEVADEGILFLNDAAQRKLPFPFKLARTWHGMEDLVQQACGHLNAIGAQVKAGHYDLVAPDGSVILPLAWDLCVQPGWLVTMRLWQDVDDDRKKEEEAFKKRALEEARAEVAEKQKKSTGEDKAPINFKDAVGRKFSFPFHLVRTWQGVEELIKQAFLHVDVLGRHVQEGRYDLIGPTGEIILPSVWQRVVEPGWHVSRNVMNFKEFEEIAEFELPLDVMSHRLVTYLLDSIRSEKLDDDWHIRPGTVLRCDSDSADDMFESASFVSIPNLHSTPYKAADSRKEAADSRKEATDETCGERRLHEAFGSINTHADRARGWSLGTAEAADRTYPVLWIRQTWVLVAGSCILTYGSFSHEALKGHVITVLPQVKSDHNGDRGIQAIDGKQRLFYIPAANRSPQLGIPQLNRKVPQFLSWIAKRDGAVDEEAKSIDDAFRKGISRTELKLFRVRQGYSTASSDVMEDMYRAFGATDIYQEMGKLTFDEFKQQKQSLTKGKESRWSSLLLHTSDDRMLKVAVEYFDVAILTLESFVSVDFEDTLVLKYFGALAEVMKDPAQSLKSENSGSAPRNPEPGDTPKQERKPSAISHLQQSHTVGSMAGHRLRRYVVSLNVAAVERRVEDQREVLQGARDTLVSLLRKLVAIQNGVVHDNEMREKRGLPHEFIDVFACIVAFVCALPRLLQRISWFYADDVLQKDLDSLTSHEVVAQKRVLSRLSAEAEKKIRTAERVLISSATGIGSEGGPESFQISVGPQYVTAQIVCNLLKLPVRNGKQATALYETYLKNLKSRFLHRPSKRHILSITALADELNLVHDFHQWQEETLRALTLILDPGTFRRRKPKPTSKPRSKLGGNRSKLYDLERKLLAQQSARLAKDIRRTSQLLAQCSRMVEDVREMAGIMADDQSRAIFIFTTVTVVFLPLSFVASYVSMSSGTAGRDWAGIQQLFWEVAAPLTSDNTLPPLEKLVETRKKERPKDKSSGGATEVLPGGNCACEDEGFRLLASSKEQTPDGAALDNATRATSYTNGLYHVSQAASPTTAPISHIFHESYLSHDFERTSYPIDPALTTYHQGETGTLSEVPGACGPNQSACSLEAFRGASYGRELDGAISVSSLATAGGDERCQVGIETGEQLSPGDDWSGNGLPYFRTSDRRHGHTIRSDDATSSILVGQTPHLDHHRAEEHADTVQPPRKRHRAGSPFRTLPSPPASTSTDIDADDVSKVAEFEEWALENVVLKRIMVDGVATFQLQFDWNLCIKHCGSKPKPPKRVQRGANRSAPQRRNSARQSKFTADEDDLILRLKDELQLPWTEIHRRHIEQYPGRSKGSLQCHWVYSVAFSLQRRPFVDTGSGTY